MRRDNKGALRRVEDLELAEVIEHTRVTLERGHCLARFPGVCPLCRKAIVKGDPISVRSGTKATHAACHKEATASKEPNA